MQFSEIYLDNSATTRAYPEVLAEVQRIMDREYGNPSSLHRRGSSAERIISSSRRTLAEILGAKEGEIIFTSGGTESNNLAIMGIARRGRRRGNHLVTTGIEHSSVLEPFEALEKEGLQVTYVNPDKKGIIDPADVAAAVTPGTVLVSVMHVNNEVGSIQPIDEIAAAIKNKNSAAVFHVDAVQSFTRLPLFPHEYGIDALSISGHKFHGPKGIGALFLREGLLIEPLFRGGGHERGIRPGTENTPAIAGMALAARLSASSGKDKMERIRSFKEKIVAFLEKEHPWAVLNGPAVEESAAHILNVSFPGLKGEIILHALEQRGIYVSTGSACHSREKKHSHVLKAMGLDEKNMEGAVRISFSHLNREDEIEEVTKRMDDAIGELRAFARM